MSIDPRDQKRRYGQGVGLLLVLLCSLPLTAVANRVAGAIIARHDPALAALSSTAIPSCLVIALLFACFGNASLLQLPAKPWNSHTEVLRLSIVWMAAWLAGALALAVAQGHWPTYVHAWPARIGFLIFGPIGEELLFRGIVQERARQVWHRSGTPAILISTAAFSLHHLFIHTAPAGLLFAQLLFTLPMGIVFATLRERTGSLWPGVALHILTNLPFAS